MNQDQNFIETVGYIKKEQKLKTIENNIIANTLVLESIHPFLGFHGSNLPEESKPRSLFLILAKEYSFEEIARITKKIKKDFKYDFNASIGKIHFKTSTYSCIRIKYLKSFTFLPELQGLYQDNGIKLARQKTFDTLGLIVINKNFIVKELEEGIYDDLEEESKYYIELPVDLPWKTFKEFTLNIKNNIDNSDFDAAQGVFYRKREIVEVVRLYICEGQMEQIKAIKKLYIDLIQKHFK